MIFLVFEENAFVTKSRANAFTHSLKKRMAAAASVAKAGSGATVKQYKREEIFFLIFLLIWNISLLGYFSFSIFRLKNVVLSVIILK